MRPWRKSGTPSLIAVNLLRKAHSELFGGVTAQHARKNGFVNPSLREDFDRLDGTGGIVMRIARAPNSFFGEIIRQSLNQALFGVEPEHHLTFFPHLFGIRADRIMVEQRNRASRGLHFLEPFLHPE